MVTTGVFIARLNLPAHLNTFTSTETLALLTKIFRYPPRHPSLSSSNEPQTSHNKFKELTDVYPYRS